MPKWGIAVIAVVVVALLIFTQTESFSVLKTIFFNYIEANK